MKESSEMEHASLAVWVETPSFVLLGEMLCQCFFIPKENFGLNYPSYLSKSGFPCDSVVKNPPANAGNSGDAYLIPETGRSPRGGNGNPLQYSCLENLMDGGDWWVMVSGVTKSQTQLNNGTGTTCTYQTKSHVLHKHGFSVHIIVFQNLNT